MAKYLPVEYATFWQRLTAFMIDLFLIVLPVFAFILIFVAPGFIDGASIKASPEPNFEFIYQLHRIMIFILLSGFALSALVLARFTTSRWQATPGKRLSGIYIIDKQGGAPKYSNAFGRFISLPLLILLIQIFERNEIYKRLDAMRVSGKYITDMDDMRQYLINPASEVTSLIVFTVIGLWFLRIFYTREKTAIHDIMFDTRVIQGKR